MRISFSVVVGAMIFGAVAMDRRPIELRGMFSDRVPSSPGLSVSSRFCRARHRRKPLPFFSEPHLTRFALEFPFEYLEHIVSAGSRRWTINGSKRRDLNVGAGRPLGLLL